MPLKSLLAVCVALCVASGVGCSSSVMPKRAQHQYSKSFDCPGALVVPTTEGYRVEGCGSTAFYRCSESPNRLDPRLSEPQRPSQRDELLLDALIASIQHGIEAPGRCSLVAAPVSRRPVTTTLPAATTSAQVALALREPEPDSLRTQTIAIDGGELELSADSQGRPDYLVLTVLATRRVFYQPCTPWLVSDGARLTVTALRVEGEQRVQLVVPSGQLRGLASRSRLDASVCGLRFSLDAAERARIADFVRGR